jgi:hypothetical protein
MPDVGTSQAPPLRLDRETHDWLSHACGTHLEVAVDVMIADAGDVFLEGRGGARTFAASLQLRDGALARRLLITCPLVSASPSQDASPRGPLLPLAQRYLVALNDGRFADAAACFSVDCLYVHPPYRTGQPQALFRGRDELVRSWPIERGTRRVATSIERCVQDGSHGFIEGIAAGGSFLASIVLDHQGLISRYVAFHTPELVPRLPGPAAKDQLT